MNGFSRMLVKYSRSRAARFHVPSHKGRGSGFSLKRAFDITELDFSDNLNYPEGLIQEAQDETAGIFGVRDTLFTLNGSTSAVIAAVCACAGEGDKVLLGGDAHVSAYYACMWAGAEPVRIACGDPVAGTSPEELADAIKSNPGAAAAVLVSPTYCGRAVRLEEACRMLAGASVAAIIDEAHGTHLPFAEGYPVSAVNAGADLVIHSGYKTVNGPVQSAMLHNVSGRTPTSCLKRWLRAVHTTSPSYPLLASLLEALGQLKSSQKTFYRIREWYNELQESLSGTPVKIANASPPGQTLTDFFKLPLDFSGTDAGAFEAKRFFGFRGIIAEACDESVLLLAMGMNTSGRDVRILKRALADFCAKSGTARAPATALCTRGTPQKACGMREAMSAPFEELPAGQCSGRVAADFELVYPPGTPLVIPGELISGEQAARIGLGKIIKVVKK